MKLNVEFQIKSFLFPDQFIFSPFQFSKLRVRMNENVNIFVKIFQIFNLIFSEKVFVCFY